MTNNQFILDNSEIFEHTSTLIFEKIKPFIFYNFLFFFIIYTKHKNPLFKKVCVNTTEVNSSIYICKVKNAKIALVILHTENTQSTLKDQKEN